MRLVFYHFELCSAGRAGIPPVRPGKDPCLVRRAAPCLPTWFTASWRAVCWRGLPRIPGAHSRRCCVWQET